MGTSFVAAPHPVPPTNPAPEMAGSQTKWLLTGLGLASWMEFYTFDAVNLVLPEIAGSFGVSADEASWLLTVFLSALLYGVAISIWLAHRIGYLRYLQGCIALFAIASIASAITTRFEVMLLWRAVLGLSGAGLSMWWRGTVYLVVPRPQRSHSMMRISVMIYASTALALLFSGYVADRLSWRLIFLPNIAFAAASMWLLQRHYPQIAPPPDPRARGMDKTSLALLAVVLILAQIMLSRGQIRGWFDATEIRWLAWASGSALLFFIGWQLHERNATRLFRLDLIAHRDVAASLVLGVFAGIVLTGSLYALPEFLRKVHPLRLDATRTGWILSTYAISAAALRPLVTWSIGKIGQRKALTFSFAMLVLSMWLMARMITTRTAPALFILPLVLYAFCLSSMLSAVASGTVARLPQETQLDAVAIYMTFRQFGASLGVTAMNAVLDWRERVHSSRLFESLQSDAPEVSRWLKSAAHIAGWRVGATRHQAQDMARELLGHVSRQQAETLAYADAFLAMAAIGLLALCCVSFMNPARVAKK